MSCYQGEYRLVEAIVDKLVADSDLVNLTGDGSAKTYQNQEYNIGQHMPESRERLPYIGIHVFNTEPLVKDTPAAAWSRSRVFVIVSSHDLINATLILDYIQGMFAGDGTVACNRAFLNFSNQYLRNTYTGFLRRRGVNFNQDRDVYEGRIELELIWLDRPCEDYCYDVDPQVCIEELECEYKCVEQSCN